ncbi:MAG: hypothetical protein J5752_03905 [Clostridiales bacterium]|nr:hypothetical protein [Clostridiales bacterium]
MFDDNYNSARPIIVNDRSTEALTEVNILIGDLKTQVAELEIKLQAMYSVIVEQGVDPQLFESKVEELMKAHVENPTEQKKAYTCPECGKAVKPSYKDPLTGKCLFCGAKIQIRPSFE